MRLVIVRHGDPDYSIDNLTEKGKREAELLKKRLIGLNVKAFYCSPLGRAKATAEPTLKALNTTIETLDWLREFDGYVLNPKSGEKSISWDLMPSYWTKIDELYDKDRWLNTDIMSSGNVAERYERVKDGLDELLLKHGYKRKGNYYKVINENRDTVVLFCHFGVEAVLLSHLLGTSPVIFWQGFVALPTSVTTLITEEREQGIAYFRCNGFGDLSHLYAENEPPSFSARFCENYLCKEERH